MGTESIAAINIASTLDMMAMVLFIGIGNATAILVGNLIGSGRKEVAYNYAGHSLLLGLLGGFIIAGILFLISPLVLFQYKVSQEVLELSQKVIYVNYIFLWIRTCNMILFIGVLRAGGDTRFALILDGLIIWVVGVPMAYIGAFVLALPVYYVFLMTLSEEFLKWFLGMRRYVTKKWIHDLTVSMQAVV
jgi:Na+-driven multidrug efflux pump